MINSVLAQPGESLSLLFEMDKLSIQEQILAGYAVREAAYEMGDTETEIEDLNTISEEE